MDSILYSQDYDDFSSTPYDQSFQSDSMPDPVESLYLVPFRWWKEADGVSGVNGVSYNVRVNLNGGDENEELMGDFGESEILISMSRVEEECGFSREEDYGSEGDLALVSEWMFLTALKWHYDKKDVESLLPEEDSADGLFTLNIRLLYVKETNQLAIKICRKDNAIAAFNRGYSIFCTKYGMLQIWDFSGQTNNLFVNGITSSMESVQSNEEIPLQLQIYHIGCSSFDSSLGMNDSVDKVNLFSRNSALGLIGLYNLGNTCFMNSAIQCLVHTPKLVDYFLGNFRVDLNFGNPLGMNGKLAVAFGDLLRTLWGPGSTPVSPTMFKSTISSFAPRFSGYNQHDSQEFLSFLLDGLHEDLNRVKCKPYIQAKDEDGRPDEEVADEHWANYLSRNDSIIVDLFQGQYRSTLVCPVCKKLSITFDPFMYLSLPLPSTTSRKMTITVVSSDGTNLPHQVTITVPGNGTLKDLVEALGQACSLRDDETLLIAEVYNNAIVRILDDPDDSIELIRDNDLLVAYKLPKDMDGTPLVVFMHEQRDKSYLQYSPSFKKFGIPLVSRMSDFSKGSEMHKEFFKLITPFLLPDEFSNDDASEKSVHEDKEMEDIVYNEATSLNNEFENDLDSPRDFEFYLEDGSLSWTRFKIEWDETVSISTLLEPVKVFVYWPEKMIQDYDTAILSVLPEVCKPALTSLWTQDSTSLYKCVDAFIKDEPLGPDDMWYCPKCKEHRQASKKLDLWRLPEILVIHLKRFSYTRYSNKLETFVDFPIQDFDLSSYVIRNNSVSHCYMLYAVSNHYGGTIAGHYTAFAKHNLNRWYEFNDSLVSPVSEEQIKSSDAYVLFYKRI